MTTPTTMEERFDEFVEQEKENDSDFRHGFFEWHSKKFKAFIQSEIDLAVEKREKEVFEWAKIKVDSFFKELLNNK